MVQVIFIIDENKNSISNKHNLFHPEKKNQFNLLLLIYNSNYSSYLYRALKVFIHHSLNLPK